MKRLICIVLAWLGMWLVPRCGRCETTVVLVRHAEKAAATKDPPLSEAGERRANELADMLGDAGIKAIFVTEYQRTARTAAPLAARIHVEPRVVPARDTSTLVKTIREIENGVVLIVGHSDTVPEIIAGLGGPAVTISDDTFDNLFILNLEPNRTSFLRLHYGLPSGAKKPLEERRGRAMRMKFTKSGSNVVATSVEGEVTFQNGTAEVRSSDGYHRLLDPSEADSLQKSLNPQGLRSLGMREELRDASQYDLVVDWEDKKREAFVFHATEGGSTSDLANWIAKECEKIWEYRISKLK